MSIADRAEVGVSRDFARVAGEAFADMASYLHTLTATDWLHETGCADWNVRHLAGHALGEAAWFANLAGGVVTGEPALPSSVYDSFYALPGEDVSARLTTAGEKIQDRITHASDQQLQEPVDMGWTRLPLWQAAYISMAEGVYHDWDLHAGFDRAATIPTPWAQQMAIGAPAYAENVAHKDGVDACPGEYRLEVGDGVGTVTISVRDGAVRVGAQPDRTPDVTLYLTADEYVRLIAGRLRLEDKIDDGSIRVEGDRHKALGLARIFKGVANG